MMRGRTQKTVERMIAAEAKGVPGGKLHGLAQRAQELPAEQSTLRSVDWGEAVLPRRISCLLRDREMHNLAAWNALSSTMGWFGMSRGYLLVTSLSGAGVVGVDDRVLGLDEGEAYLVQPGQAYYFLRFPRDFEWLTVSFDLDGHERDETLGGLSHAPHAVSRKCRRLFTQFLGAYLGSSSAREALDVAVTLRELLSELVAGGPVDRPDPELTLSEKARAVVIQERGNALEAEELASRMELSVDDLKREFEIPGGVGLGVFLRSVRLCHAADLLHEPGVGVGEVANRCGFANAEFFEQAFEDSFRCPPDEYPRKFAPGR